MTETDVPPTTRQLILDAAEDLFAAQGYQATTIRQVADRVGIQGPALYKHFASKRALFEEVLERLFAPFLELLAEDPPRGGDLEAVLRQHVANPNASRILQHATLSGGEDLALLTERWYLPFFAGVRAAVDASETGLTPVGVMAFHSMLLGYLTLAPLHQAIFDVDPLADDALAELLTLLERSSASVPGGDG